MQLIAVPHSVNKLDYSRNKEWDASSVQRTQSKNNLDYSNQMKFFPTPLKMLNQVTITVELNSCSIYISQVHQYKQAVKLDHLNQHQNHYCALLVVTLVRKLKISTFVCFLLFTIQNCKPDHHNKYELHHCTPLSELS